jgi:O-acetyl-ADP-ribose deacetylase (regulator of RNase III)
MSVMSDTRIKLVIADITTLAVDAIVSAANEALIGGSGVDGAIHRAAGPGLFEECRQLGYCAEGEARLTKGYRLPARFVIHAVGPVWEGGEFGEKELLASCYRESVALAERHNLATLAFPCIATGAHEFPQDEGCRIAVDVVRAWLDSHQSPDRVTFCCFSESDARPYRERLGLVGLLDGGG